MAQQIIHRVDTAANWTSLNPVLALGELCYEVDSVTGKRAKLGDGTSAWNDLEYTAAGAGADGDPGADGEDGVTVVLITATDPLPDPPPPPGSLIARRA